MVLGAVTGDATVSSTAGSTMVTIGASDPITVSLTGPAEVAEGDPAMYTVTLSGGTSTADVVVPYILSGTAESGTDYTPPSGSVTIPASATSGTIEIVTTNDGPGEADETLIVTLQTPTGGGGPAASLTVGAANAVTTTLSETIRISMAGPTATVEEGSTVMLEVTLTKVAPAGGISVSYTISDGSNPGEAAAADYTDVTAGSISFGEGETAANIAIMAEDDSAPEGEEVFTVVLGAVTGDATVSSTARSTMVTIGASDPITVSLTGPAEVAEGDPAMYTVTLSGGTSTADVVVPYILSGTAESGTDYTPPSGSVTIPASATSGTIEIVTTNDGPGEADETLIVTLQTPTGGGGPAASLTVGAANAVTTTLSEPIRISMRLATEDVDEGDTVMLGVTLTEGAPAGGISVSYTISDGRNLGEAAAADYTDVTAGSTSFGEGETAANIAIMAVDDSAPEGEEVFTVTLGAVTGDATVSSAVGSTMVTIGASDPITVSLTGPAEVAEGDPAMYTVTLSGGTSTADVVVPYILSGTAESGTDYTPPSGSVTIPASATSGTIEIRTTNDGPGEADETLIVTLQTPTGGGGPAGSVMVDGTANAVTTTLSETIRISMAGPTATVEEGSTVMLEVTLTKVAPAGGISVSYTISDGSNPGEAAAADYTDVTAGSTSFGEGETAANIAIMAEDDSAPEGEEVFTVVLGAVTGDATVSSAAGSTVVTIGASDPITVSLTGPAEVDEGDPAMYTVTLSGGTSTADVMVPYTLSGTAESGTDYTPPSGSVTIPASATSGTIEIVTTNDGRGEADETLIVTLQTPTGGGGPAASLTVGIANAVTTTLSETIRVSMRLATEDVDEGSSLALEVTLTEAAPAGGISVSYTISDGSNLGEAAAADYTDVTAGSISFGEGESTAEIRITAVQDALTEGDETFTVTLMGVLPAGQVKLATTGTVSTVTIGANTGIDFDAADGVTIEDAKLFYYALLSGLDSAGRMAAMRSVDSAVDVNKIMATTNILIGAGGRPPALDLDFDADSDVDFQDAVLLYYTLALPGSLGVGSTDVVREATASAILGPIVRGGPLASSPEEVLNRVNSLFNR